MRRPESAISKYLEPDIESFDDSDAVPLTMPMDDADMYHRTKNFLREKPLGGSAAGPRLGKIEDGGQRRQLEVDVGAGPLSQQFIQPQRGRGIVQPDEDARGRPQSPDRPPSPGSPGRLDPLRPLQAKRGIGSGLAPQRLGRPAPDTDEQVREGGSEEHTYVIQ